MFEVGRICVKIAGRDANEKCVVVEVIDKNYVMIDGATRRRKCNVDHLEPLNQKIDIKKGATHEEVKKAFEKLGFEVRDTKPKNVAAKPVQARKGAEKQQSNVQDAKVVKKASPKKETKAVKAEEKAEKPVKKAPAKKAKKEE